MTTATEIPVHPETGEPLEDIAARIHADHAHLQGLKADVTATLARIEADERDLLKFIPQDGARALRLGRWSATAVTVSRGKRAVDRQACRAHRGALRRAGAATRRLTITWSMPTVAILDDPDIQARLQARGVSIDDLIIKPVETVAVRLVDLDATA